MKRRIIVSLFVSMFVCASVCQAGFLGSGRIKKAQEFERAQMMTQAISTLQEEINENPTNAEAHLLLGEYYLRTGDGAAHERFASALALNSKNASKISGLYMAGGKGNLQKGNPGNAKELFLKAVSIDSSLKTGIAKDFQTQGKAHLQMNAAKNANSYFKEASYFDSSLNPAICDDFYNAGKSHNDDKQLEFWQLSDGYCKGKYNQEIGTSILNFAKNQPKEEKKKLVELAKKYVDQSVIDGVIPPPEWKTVFKKEYIGIGFTGGPEKNGAIYAAKFGEDILVNDLVSVTGDNVEAYGGDKSGWMKNPEPIKNKGTRGFLGVRAPKGEKIVVEVKRLDDDK